VRLEDAGKKLRVLSKTADAVGFELIRGHIEPVRPGMDIGEGDWTGYGPTID
jgi:hypothetical protein